jgi:DNA (cytosine-5)-methyltransferase 1
MSSSLNSSRGDAERRLSSAPRTAISLFTGAGGLDLGFEAAGFETRVAVEMEHDAVQTLRHNRPEWAVINDSIHNPLTASSKAILRHARLGVGEADVLIGGPPCQPFSKSGYWASGDAKRLSDPRADTLTAYLRVLRETQPRAFLLENVPGLAFSQKDEGLNLLRRSIDTINKEIGTHYTFHVTQLRASEFGVPQDRHRVFVIGHRDGASFRFPLPRHTVPRAEGVSQGVFQQLADVSCVSVLAPHLTAWDAIGDLQDDDDPSLRATGKWADLLSSIPEGSNYLYHTERGAGLRIFGWRRRYWNFLLKLAKTLPSWTLAAQPGPAIGPFHWKSRRLSPLEMMRLQTFPSNYVIQGNLRSAQRQIGNAVPSLLAEVLGLEIRRQLLGDREISSAAPKLLPSRRGGMPGPEPLKVVPRKYLSLVAEHQAHPGTGLGYGAIKRAAAS